MNSRFDQRGIQIRFVKDQNRDNFHYCSISGQFQLESTRFGRPNGLDSRSSVAAKHDSSTDLLEPCESDNEKQEHLADIENAIEEYFGQQLILFEARKVVIRLLYDCKSFGHNQELDEECVGSLRGCEEEQNSRKIRRRGIFRHLEGRNL